MDADWYEGPEEKMYPFDWRIKAMDYADELKGGRKAEALGVDPGEGEADTSIYGVDKLGVTYRWSGKTQDTSKIEDRIVDATRATYCPMERVFIDRGGGGKQVADYLRRKGHQVQTVAFGESVTPQKKRGMMRSSASARRS